ncbi:hypothetical protein AJ79_01318 [Helicocarpus griseus UAMH5409]|uniref:RecA family profile 1 domain-containing protein n=1 Tax=Helicocarpus griseus UAMH5409 TaxID=1447875 RepID=A0A2B7Y7J7_9EURO|nr:hypothetical protein AJ79_01318 [Helicocarpus griseus UAMH5409]
MDLLLTMPDFPTKPYSHILPSLERAKVSVKDLVLLDPLEIAKQAKVDVTDVRVLAGNVINALHRDLGLDRCQERISENGNTEAAVRRDEVEEVHGEQTAKQGHRLQELSFISTLDPVLDAALAGGISTGYVTELAGESGSGKTQFLLHLLLSVQLPPPYGSSRKALYLSTESNLPTGRLSQLVEEHPLLSSLPEGVPQPSLENILSITTIDLESQDHILNYQIPVATRRHNIGLIVIDSITANYRAESDLDNVAGLLARAWQLKKLGHFLRNLAVKENIAVVVANQVSDRIQIDDVLWADEPEPPTRIFPNKFPQQQSPRPEPASLEKHITDAPEAPRSSPLQQLELPSSPIPSPAADGEDDSLSFSVLDLYTLLKVDYQRPFFTGWGDTHESTLGIMDSNSAPEWKTPALGIVWTNQIACRIVLKMENVRVAVKDIEGYSKESGSNAVLSVPSAHSASDACGSAQRAEGESSAPSNPELPQNNLFLDTESAETKASRKETPENQKLEHAKSAAETGDGNPFIPASSYRKRRTFQVVFSPWTSGDPNQTLSQDETGTIAEDEMVEFDPTVDEVLYEILPGGIRGINQNGDG